MINETEWVNRVRNLEYPERVIMAIRVEYDEYLRRAIKQYLHDHADPKTDYGIQWYPRDEIMKAIEKAQVEEV